MADATRALPGNRHDEPSSPSPEPISVAILVTTLVGHFWKADPGHSPKAPKPIPRLHAYEPCKSVTECSLFRLSLPRSVVPGNWRTFLSRLPRRPTQISNASSLTRIQTAGSKKSLTCGRTC